MFPSDEFIVIFGVFFSFSHKLICRGITPMKHPIGQCGTTCNQWYPPLASKPPFRGVRSQPCLTPETPNHPPFFGAQVRSQRSLGRTSGTCHGRHGRHCCLPGHWWWRGRFAGSSAVLVGLLVMQQRQTGKNTKHHWDSGIHTTLGWLYKRIPSPRIFWTAAPLLRPAKRRRRRKDSWTSSAVQAVQRHQPWCLDTSDIGTAWQFSG